jgi:hypothetical protein
MPEGLGPRFALEAGFLILLAGVAAYARLSATEIILVMAAGWLLASIFEVLAARRERLYPAESWERRVEAVEKPVEQEPQRRPSWFRRRADVAAPSGEEPAAAGETPVAAEEEQLAAEETPPAAEEMPPAPEHEPAVAKEEPVVAEADVVAAERVPAAEPAAVSRSRQVDDEATGEIESVEPKRRWFRRTRAEPKEDAAEVVARPSARHVRLIRGTESEDAAADERKDVDTGS